MPQTNAAINAKPLAFAPPEALSALHAQCFPRGWSTAEFDDLAAEPTVFGYVLPALAGPQEVKAFIVLRQAADEAEIVTFAVQRGLRGQGVGEALLHLAMADAARRGVAELFLDVAVDNDPAIGLYLKLGFEPIGERKMYYQDGKDAVAMKLLIA